MLKEYNKKRDFKQTAEPGGKLPAGKKDNTLAFVVQRHDASRLHYDFRLELGKVLVSWAVPKGPSMNPQDKRLAVHVEDHPFDYKDFYGSIPEGNYGAGEVEIWDEGVYFPIDKDHQKISETQAKKNLAAGELKILMAGEKLKGEFVIVRIKKDDKNWLLIKHKDEYAVEKDYDIEKIASLKKKKALADNAETKKPVAKAQKEPAVKKTAAPKKPATPKAGSAKAEPVKKKPVNFKNIKPMLAQTSAAAFDDAKWIYETKWDGYRTIAEKQGEEATIYSRNLLSFNKKFPAILEAIQTSLQHDVVLDGEVIALVKGKPSFQALQHAEETKPKLEYRIFDILELDGNSLLHLPLTDRKKLLQQLLENTDHPALKYSEHTVEKGTALFEKLSAKGFEGIMAKKADSEYTPGARTADWLKIKHINDREAIIAGYTKAGGSRNHFGALILAEKTDSGYKFIGHTGTGFTEKTLAELHKQMQPLIREKSVFDEKIKVNAPVTWIEPQLVCTIHFTEQTDTGMLRHPVFKGLRGDKNPDEVTATTEPETQEDNGKKFAKNDIVMVNKKEVPITNPDKIYFPEKGITKGDVIAYYHAVAPYILPHLKNRPLSLKRNPNGIHEESFYHKNAGENIPSWVKTFQSHSESAERDITYIVCNNAETLIHVANLGCIEMNPWNSTILKKENPTWLVIDLDPADKNTFEQVIETALAVKEVTDKAALKTWCKTSGSSGLHIYIPLAGRYDYDFVKGLAEILASLTHDLVPEFTSLERNLKKRGQKIYVDFLQNRRGQTLASVYSLRPVVAASVSTPLDWSEVKKGLHPSQFDIFNTMKRLEKKGDLFAPVLKEKNDVKKALKLLKND